MPKNLCEASNLKMAETFFSFFLLPTFIHNDAAAAFLSTERKRKIIRM